MPLSPCPSHCSGGIIIGFSLFLPSIKKAEHWRADAFELCCWRRVLRVCWTAGRSNESIQKEANLKYSLEGLMMKLKVQQSGHLMQKTDSLEKDPDAGKDWRQNQKGAAADEMVWWHHWLNGHELEQTPEIVKDREVWHAAVNGVTKSRTQLSDWTTTFSTWLKHLCADPLHLILWTAPECGWQDTTLS